MVTIGDFAGITTGLFMLLVSKTLPLAGIDFDCVRLFSGVFELLHENSNNKIIM